MFTEVSPGKSEDCLSTFCFLETCTHGTARVSRSLGGNSRVLNWGPLGHSVDCIQLVGFEGEGRIVCQ